VDIKARKVVNKYICCVVARSMPVFEERKKEKKKKKKSASEVSGKNEQKYLVHCILGQKWWLGGRVSYLL
jgi:hypothetical protein